MRNNIILLFLSFILFSSCDMVLHHRIKGNGDLKKISKNVSRTDRIKVSDGIDLVLTHGEPGIEIEADENLLRYIEVRTHDGWLEIRAKNNYRLESKNNITAYVSAETLRALKVAGSGNVSSDGEWTLNGTFKLDVAGSGDVVLDLRATNVEADIAGSGNIELGGTADRLNLDIAGSGNFKGYGLVSNIVDINVAGSGEAEVTAEEELKVSVAGSGDIRYRGNATVKKSIAGSGSVEKTD